MLRTLPPIPCYWFQAAALVLRSGSAVCALVGSTHAALGDDASRSPASRADAIRVTRGAMETRPRTRARRRGARARRCCASAGRLKISTPCRTWHRSCQSAGPVCGRRRPPRLPLHEGCASFRGGTGRLPLTGRWACRAISVLKDLVRALAVDKDESDRGRRRTYARRRLGSPSL